MSRKTSANVKKFLATMKAPVLKPANRGALLGDLEESLPFLRLFLVGCSDGEHSVPGGFVGLFVADAGAKLMLSSDQTGRRAYVTGQNWLELLRSADEGLESGKLDWRPYRPNGKPRRRGKSGG